MITPKQRAFLKSLAHNIEPIMNIGKYGVNDETIRQLDLVLEKRELVKIKILNNNLDDDEEIVNFILQKTRAEFVQHIGNKFVIYRRKRKDENRIELPE
ncbi:MAG: ribosome assembly RNA-binding protein YhbY [Parvimonas sp.]|uniref:ribosome assembly RNA-binding protein YhbY n=1 Tax=Parvimonas sp. TaxID=1944660 RepID=UPI0025CC199D|nr:ribosome assembly RNA-binding protein YhbY [Parvimonas sp.]MCI5997703.1 ribosome assembly RNA-binding protein YhbY [Parvimonas sp.]